MAFTGNIGLCFQKYIRYTTTRISTPFLHLSLRNASTSSIFGEKLISRQIIKMSGPDTISLLQGIITNDVRHLVDNNETSVVLPCIYSFLLNIQGRIMHDIFLYKEPEIEDSIFLECDNDATSSILKMLKIYRLKKKVDFVKSPYVVSVIFSDYKSDNFDSTADELTNVAKELAQKHKILTVKDPRLSALGFRMVGESRTLEKGLQDFTSGQNKYTKLRYQYGIGEGGLDLPIGQCFPLESNGDYVHAISFQKGCYIGQELTSRTYYTGVVRKRLMPIFIETQDDIQKIPANCAIENSKKKNVGKFRQCIGNFGLGLMRVEECLPSEELTLKGFDAKVKVEKPQWWPLKAKKVDNS